MAKGSGIVQTGDESRFHEFYYRADGFADYAILGGGDAGGLDGGDTVTGVAALFIAASNEIVEDIINDVTGAKITTDSGSILTLTGNCSNDDPSKWTITSLTYTGASGEGLVAEGAIHLSEMGRLVSATLKSLTLTGLHVALDDVTMQGIYATGATITGSMHFRNEALTGSFTSTKTYWSDDMTAELSHSGNAIKTDEYGPYPDGGRITRAHFSVTSTGAMVAEATFNRDYNDPIDNIVANMHDPESFREYFFRGNDSFIGLATADVFMGYMGDDTMNAGNGNDTLDGGIGNDSMLGGAGDDSIRGGAGNDITDAGDGNDIIATGNGNDTVNAGAGDDIVTGGDGAGNDSYNGGAGVDTIVYTSAYASITVDLNKGKAKSITGTDTAGIGTDKLSNIENVVAGNYADTLTGSKVANTLTGGDGNDIFIFNTTLNSKTNVDTITDFTVGNDKIQLSKAIFKAFRTTSALMDTAFYSAPDATNAQDLDDRIIYDITTGALYYDADGNKEKGAAGIKIAIIGIDSHPSLAYSDLQVIA